MLRYGKEFKFLFIYGTPPFHIVLPISTENVFCLLIVTYLLMESLNQYKKNVTIFVRPEGILI